MKKTFTQISKLFLALPLIWSANGAIGQDLIIESVSANYDIQTALLTDITYNMKNVGSFTTFGSVINEVFIVDIGSTSWKIGENTSDDFGLNSESSETFTIADVDLDDISGLPSGTYYLKIIVDVDDDEEEDNEANNSFTLIGSPFEFESLVTVKEVETILSFIDNYPNPANYSTKIKYEFTVQPENTVIKFYNISGSIVKEVAVVDKQNELEISVMDMEPGIYFYSIVTDGLVLGQRKLVVTH